MNKNVSIYKVIISEISNREVNVFEEMYLPVISVEQLSHFIGNVIFEIEECGNNNFTYYRLKQLKWLLKKLKSSLKSGKFNYKGKECVSVKNYPVSIFNLVDNIFQNSFYDGSKYSNIEYFICH
jgi:hypothetical protein